MPRQSIEDLTTPRVDGRPAPLTCRTGAPDEVRQIFAELVKSVGPDHFARPDGVLLEQYCQAIALGRRAYAELETSGPVVDGRPSPWVPVLEKAHRSAVALAARLRLCPQSRFDRLKAGTAAREYPGDVFFGARLARGEQ